MVYLINIKNLSPYESSSDNDSSDDEKNNLSQILKFDTKNQINIYFTSPSGFKDSIHLDKNVTIGNLLKSFLLKIGLSPSTNSIYFLFNGAKLSLDDNRTLEKVFINGDDITFIDNINIIGA